MSIWTEIDLRKKTDFKNPYFKHISQLTKVKSIPVTEFYRLRVWREYFYKFSDSIYDPNYVLDSNEQLDVCVA